MALNVANKPEIQWLLAQERSKRTESQEVCSFICQIFDF